MFAGNLSPVGTPPARTDRVLNIYSRHSRDNSQGSEIIHTDPAGAAEPPMSSENTSQLGEEEETKVNDPVHISDVNMGTPAGAVYKVKSDSVTLHSTPIDKSEGLSVSPRTVAKLQLDELVGEYSQTPQQTVQSELVSDVQSRERDREVEFENPGDTEDSSEPTNTTSSCSLLDDDEDSR